jgi:chromate reductase, NAD(P)H dehydrogenase (quinone)
MRVLAISGSLRANSSNTSALKAAARLAPDGMNIVIFDGLARLPYFNPDLDTDSPPNEVRASRRAVGKSDGLLICSPEYARGVAGAMKNALDWLVGSFEFPGKPVALFNTSPRASHSDAQLRLTLTTMAGCLIESASITLPLLGRNLDADDIAGDAELSSPMRAALQSFAEAIISARTGS